MFQSVHVRAPCRLHFGMFSFGHADRPQFGGVGIMIEPPCVEVRVSPADRLSVSGDNSKRVMRFATMAAEAWKLGSPPSCRLEVHSPPEHTGLGVGTQLGLALAAGLRKFLALPDLSAEALAKSVGRGHRSAVGTHGFQLGGLIVDAGKQAGERLATLAQRIPIPECWRFVLVRPPDESGLAGDVEAAAFSSLTPVPIAVTDELWRITNQEMMPALAEENCELFGDAVYRFGRLAGECFAKAQGGAFASPRIEGLVAAIRDLGMPGVGQSSWGPTVFAVAANPKAAERLARLVRETEEGADCEVSIAAPNNGGAMVKVL